MATFNAFGNFTFDYVNPNSMGLGELYNTMPSVTPNVVTVSTTTGYFEIYGSGFSINPPGGHVSSVAFFRDGSKVAEMTDLSISALEVFGYLQMSDEGAGAYALLNRCLNGSDTFNLGSANDVIAGLTGNDVINAGGGTDASIYFGLRSEFTVDVRGDGSVQVSHIASGERDVLNDVEIVAFTDGELRLDLDGNAGQAFRLYQAAFDRTPDAGGLEFWINRIDGGTSLEQAAASFIASEEFVLTYGNLSNEGFIGALYANVLDRAPDQEGLDFWVEQLAGGARSLAQVLVGFSESPENVELVGGAISDGIWI